MCGEPEDVAGQCNARLFIGDNFMDNHATMRCQLAPEHQGLHEERYGDPGDQVVVTWERDQREEARPKKPTRPSKYSGRPLKKRRG
jgi:hypothetical protein